MISTFAIGTSTTTTLPGVALPVVTALDRGHGVQHETHRFFAARSTCAWSLSASAVASARSFAASASASRGCRLSLCGAGAALGLCRAHDSAAFLRASRRSRRPRRLAARTRPESRAPSRGSGEAASCSRRRSSPGAPNSSTISSLMDNSSPTRRHGGARTAPAHANSANWLCDVCSAMQSGTPAPTSRDWRRLRPRGRRADALAVDALQPHAERARHLVVDGAGQLGELVHEMRLAALRCRR